MSRIAATISILVLGPGTMDAQLDDSHWSFSLESAYTFNVIPNPWKATFLGEYRKSGRNYNFVTEIVSARYAITNPGGPLFLRGNLEMSGGLVRTVIVKGPESYFGGSVLGLRYNFIQPGAKLIPYAELRGGGGWCDSKGAEPLIANRLHIYVFHWGRFSLRRKFSLQRDGRRTRPAPLQCLAVQSELRRRLTWRQCGHTGAILIFLNQSCGSSQFSMLPGNLILLRRRAAAGLSPNWSKAVAEGLRAF